MRNWPYDSSKTRRDFTPNTYPYFAAEILKDATQPYLHVDEIFAELLRRGYRVAPWSRPDKRTMAISLYERTSSSRGLVRGPIPGSFALTSRWTALDEEAYEEANT